MPYLTDTEAESQRAELRELRRKAWNWEEARRIASLHPLKGPEIRERVGRELLIFVAGDGDAEWERKAQETTR